MNGGWPPDWWFNEKHGLHGEIAHQAHDPMDLCTPLNDAVPPPRTLDEFAAWLHNWAFQNRDDDKSLDYHDGYEQAISDALRVFRCIHKPDGGGAK